MINLLFDDSPLSTGHSIRGVGSYIRNLRASLDKVSGLKLVDEPDASIAHYPYFDLFFNSLRLDNKKKNVVTVYDVIPLIYPSHYPPGIKGKINFLRQKAALKKVDAVITISETSKKDIVRFLDIPADKIHVTYLAASSEFKKLADGKWKTETREKYSLPQEFVLYVGDVNYNKNLNNLAKACKISGVDLVIVGKQAASQDFDKTHPENQSLLELLNNFGNDTSIKRLGFVLQEDLVKIVNLASLCCQPSLYEGFGLPILEALNCGIPVIASKIQVFVELFENSVLYFDPYDAKNISIKINQALSEKKTRETLVSLGTVRSNKYNWDKTVKDTLNVYKSLE